MKRAGGDRPSSWAPSSHWIGALGGLAVAAVAIVPPAAYLAQGIPVTVTPIVLPSWFRTVAPKLNGHPVVLVLPAPFTTTKPDLTWRGENGQKYPLSISGKESAMTWAALSGQRFSMVGGGGLDAGVKHRAGENQGQNVITQVTFAYGSRPNVSRSDIEAVHRALSEWMVTTVVLPDQSDLPAYDRVASVTAMTALISAATGETPVRTADAWVWNDVNRYAPRSFPSGAQYTACTVGRSRQGRVAVRKTVTCVLAGQH